MLHLNKKGVSEIISYVLLVIIAVGLSVFVYNYLDLFVPKEKAECGQDISLIIKDYVCQSKLLNLTLLNKGLFTIDAVYIRAGTENQKVRDLLNGDNVYFGIIQGQKGLNPGKTFSKIYITTNSNLFLPGGTYTVEVQPAVFSGNDLALCNNAVVTQKITCT